MSGDYHADRYDRIVAKLMQSSDKEAASLISRHVGNMALVRADGKGLQEAGIIPELVCRLRVALSDNFQSESGLLACAALRDMGCGSAASRKAVRFSGGLVPIVDCIKRFHGIRWENLYRDDLRSITVAAGAIRNLAHSTRENCEEFHRLGATDDLSWRLLHGNSPKGSDVSRDDQHLPEAGSPWREASFRSAGALINMAEKCSDCAEACASNFHLIDILVASWGGKNKRGKAAVIHPGLHIILKLAAAKYSLDSSLVDALEREETRRKHAQEREGLRKKNLLLTSAQEKNSVH